MKNPFIEIGIQRCELTSVTFRDYSSKGNTIFQLFCKRLLVSIDRRPIKYFPGGSDDQKILIANPKGIDKLYLIHDLLIRLMDEQYTLLMDFIETNSDEFEEIVGLDGDDEVGLLWGKDFVDDCFVA